MKNITIHRDNNSQPSTTISNHIINDRNLSAEARFLLIWLLACDTDDDTKITFEKIASETGISISKISRAIKELTDAGYLRINKSRPTGFGAGRSFITTYEIFEQPVKE